MGNGCCSEASGGPPPADGLGHYQERDYGQEMQVLNTFCEGELLILRDARIVAF